MRPPVRERLGWQDGVPHGREDRAVMARSLMYLFGAGALVTVGALVAGVGNHDEVRIAVSGAIALAAVGLLFLGYDRIPVWGFQVFLTLGTALVGWSIYASGDTTSPYAAFYFWIAIYSFYFLDRRRATLQMAFVAIAYASVLLSSHGVQSTPVVH